MSTTSRRRLIVLCAALVVGTPVVTAPHSAGAREGGGERWAVPRGWTADQVRTRLAQDSTLRVGAGGNLYVVDPGHEALEAAASEPSSPAMAPLVPYAQTFTLHSKPGSSRTIYLDFNGHVAAGTWWNGQPGLGPSITSIAMDLDNTLGTFSTFEQEFIQGMWARVADDYDMFDVDVTTEEPPLTDIVRNGTADLRFGTRVVITNSNFTTGALGVAYVGTFGHLTGIDNPAYVFTRINNAPYQVPHSVAQGISHEVGHTLGLFHDGVKDASGMTVKEYYGGTSKWAPIMGSAGASTYPTWSRGEYTNANNQEDDLSVMALMGVSPEADDVGGTIGSATPLAVLPGGAFFGSGRIETRSDVDVWWFDSAGHVELTVGPTAPTEPNLDLQARLLDASGNVVATSDPADRGRPSFSLDVTPGRYYLRLDGVGQGNPLTDGYSDYASLGGYRVGEPNGTPTAAAAVIDGATAFQKQFSSAGSSDPEGQALSYQWDFGDGTTSLEANPLKTYSRAGNFSVTLIVTDVANQQAVALLSVAVGDPAKQLRIDSIVGARVRPGTARVRVTVVDGNGNPVRGVAVRGKWAGSTTNRTAYTNASGVATFVRYTSKAVVFSTNRVSKTGRVWDGVNAATGVTAATR